MNKICLLGGLVSKPEVRYTTDQIPLCVFTLAVARPHKYSETDYIRCIAWRKQAELIAQYSDKGRQLCVSGYLTMRSYNGKDGIKRYVSEVNVEAFDFVHDGKKYNGLPLPEDYNRDPEDVTLIGDGDIPF